MNSLSKYIAVILVFAGVLYVTGDSALSRFQDKEVIDAVTVKDTVTYAYKGQVLPSKITEDEVPELRTDSSYSELVSFNDNGTVTIRTRTFSGATYFKDGNTWNEIEYGYVAKKDFKLNVPLARLISGKVYATTIFSGAGDGFTENGDSTWSLSHDATASGGAGLGANYSFTSLYIQARNSTSIYFIDRVYIPFDTSSIPSNATISSATLNVYAFSSNFTNTDNDGDDWVNVVQTSQASETTLASADFDQAGSITNPTEGSTRIDLGSISLDSYNTWTLDSTGRGWIKKSGETANCGATAGWTCLGLREGHDAINSAVGVGIGSLLGFNSSETTGTSQDPYLDITYTVPSSTFTGLLLGDKKLEIGNAKLEIGS